MEVLSRLRHQTWTLRRAVWLWIPLVAVALIVLVALLGGGWYYSDQIEDGALKVDESKSTFDLEIAEIGEGRVTLRVTPDTKKDGDWTKDGIWGLELEGAYGQVGPILQISDQEVVREFQSLEGDPTTGDIARIDSFAYPGDPQQAHGLPFEEVHFSTPSGDFPAWFVEGSSRTWAIFVHGRGAARTEALRILPTLAVAGLPSLIITYRNDKGVPANPDGYHRFGETEWEDLEGAASYATEQGAEDLILVGYSMGGAIVASFLYQSPLAEKVRGVILDAPMLDFGATIDHGASQRSIPIVGLPIPGVVTSVAKVIAGIRFDIDLSEWDYLNRADELAAPILLFHGDADKTVPVKTSDALAKARPDIVEYVRRPDTGHVRSWNRGRDEYEAAVLDFLQDLAQ